MVELVGAEESCFLLQELLLLLQRLLNYDEVMQQLLDGEQRRLVPNLYDGLVDGREKIPLLPYSEG